MSGHCGVKCVMLLRKGGSVPGIVEAGPVHTGLTSDPAVEADRLLARLVR
jgi:hypothetical protein